MRLIDADALMREFAEFVRESNNSDFADVPRWNDAVSLLGCAPTIDRPQGEWKHLEGDEWVCSNCGYVVWTEGSWEHPLERGKDFCEHCGARMKGASDENQGN